jgi:hypothetical protein
MFLRDPRAAALFENTYSGALRSYWAVLVILPVYLLVIAIESVVPSTSIGNFGVLSGHSGLLVASLAEFCVFTLCWFVAWPLVVDRIAPYLGCEENFFRYVSAYNWMHVPYVLGGLLFWGGALTGVIHSGNHFTATLTLVMILWVYHWFVLRHALGLNGGFAAMMVAGEFLLVTMLLDVIQTVAY